MPPAPPTAMTPVPPLAGPADPPAPPPPDGIWGSWLDMLASPQAHKNTAQSADNSHVPQSGERAMVLILRRKLTLRKRQVAPSHAHGIVLAPRDGFTQETRARRSARLQEPTRDVRLRAERNARGGARLDGQRSPRLARRPREFGRSLGGARSARRGL